MTGRRHVRFSERSALEPGRLRALVLMAEAGPRVRRKPRTEEELHMLRVAALASIRERLASGRLERVGQREYILGTRPKSESQSGAVAPST